MAPWTKPEALDDPTHRLALRSGVGIDDGEVGREVRIHTEKAQDVTVRLLDIRLDVIVKHHMNMVEERFVPLDLR